jgi:hypothetical protein
MKDLTDIPSIVYAHMERERVDPEHYPDWLFRLAQAWWAVLPPTQCAIRMNGEEAIIDTISQKGNDRCSLRLDLVECRIRLNEIDLAWIENYAVTPQPLTPFYASVDSRKCIDLADAALLVAVMGALSYPTHQLSGRG